MNSLKLRIAFVLFFYSAWMNTTPLLGNETSYQFFGRHLLTQYYDCNVEALNNTKQLAEIMKQATLLSGTEVLHSIDYTFQPCGFTMILLLSESHASIHTYPEHKSCFIDFFTCGHRCSAEKFDAVLRNYLQPKQVLSDIRLLSLFTH